MLNQNDFILKLKKIIDYYGVSAASFADTIKVPRSSISHIISGRNKPSLDFVLKITESYKEVDLHWLLKGVGDFPKTNFPPTKNNSEKIDSPVLNFNEEKNLKMEPKKINTDLIEKVLIFYKDGTFSIHKSRK